MNGSSSTMNKADFAPVGVEQVLAKVARVPITTWRYKEGEGGVRHLGPMAEDFWAAFSIGYGDHTIADLDARGVALAAIQGLHQTMRQQMQQKDRELAQTEAQTAIHRGQARMVRSTRLGRVAVSLQMRAAHPRQHRAAGNRAGVDGRCARRSPSPPHRCGRSASWRSGAAAAGDRPFATSRRASATDWCPGPESNRHDPLRSGDFPATSAFAAPCGFVVWSTPSP